MRRVTHTAFAVSAVVVLDPRQSQPVPRPSRREGGIVQGRAFFPQGDVLDEYRHGWEFQDMEHLIRSVVLTPLDHLLSFQILETNAKSVNMGRTRSLLNLRKSRDYPSSDISDTSYCCDGLSQHRRCPSPASFICGSLRHTRGIRKRGKTI